MNSHTDTDTGDVITSLASGLAALGMVTMALFPLAIPCIALTVAAIVPLALPVVVLGLLAAVIAAPLIALRNMRSSHD